MGSRGMCVSGYSVFEHVASDLPVCVEKRDASMGSGRMRGSSVDVARCFWFS